MTDILRITQLATRKLGVECPVGHREPQALPQRQGNPTAMTMILQNGEKIPSAQPFGMTAPVLSTSTVNDSPWSWHSSILMAGSVLALKAAVRSSSSASSRKLRRAGPCVAGSFRLRWQLRRTRCRAGPCVAGSDAGPGRMKRIIPGSPKGLPSSLAATPDRMQGREDVG